MNCKRCNTELQEDSVFCAKCGEKVEGPLMANGAGTNPPEKVKRFAAMKKVLAFGMAALVLFVVWAVLSPDDTTTAPQTADNQAASAKTASQTQQKKATNQPEANDSGTQTAQADLSGQTQESQPPAKVRNGFYKVSYSDGSYYEGNFVNGKKQGQGTFVTAKGIKYVGDFADNQITGQEVVTYPNGDCYEGAMVRGYRDGSGKYTFASGEYYDGMWSEGKRHGYGVTYYANGNVYEGCYVNGLRQDSQGKLTYSNGVVYEGEFNNDKMTGQATKYYSDGIYRGSFVDGKRSGYGQFIWESGSVYDGYWENDKRNGEGSYYNANTGGTDFGTWQDGVLVAAG